MEIVSDDFPILHAAFCRLALDPAMPK
jgi:hypothetical protein